MDELERRLRSALVELAEEVPPSHNAWADHERRLALKSRRARVRPGLMAAVAAAVVALIAVPVMIFNLKSGGVEQGAIPTSDSSPSPAPTLSSPAVTSRRYDAIASEHLLMAPYQVGTVDKGLGNWDVLVYSVYQDDVRSAVLCSITLPYGAAINSVEQAKYGAKPTCNLLRAPAKRLLWYQGFIPDGSGSYVYVMAPQVQSVLVWSDRGYLLASRIGSAKDFSVMHVNVGTSPPQKYTARDEHNNTLENG